MDFSSSQLARARNAIAVLSSFSNNNGTATQIKNFVCNYIYGDRIVTHFSEQLASDNAKAQTSVNDKGKIK